MKPTDDASSLDDDGWEGNVEKLARVASDILAARGFADDPPNDRLIRDYTQRGIVSRPQRQGKEAVYGRRHLLEVVAARVLVKDGWPLAKIAEHFPSAPDQELFALISGKAKENLALSVARRLIRESALAMPTRRPPTQVSNVQAELRAALRKLGMPLNRPAVEQLTLIAIAPWCQVLVESSRLQRVTEDEAEEVGRAVTASLLDPTIRKGGK